MSKVDDGRRWPLILVLAAIALLVAPAAVWASHDFTDVSEGQTFHEDIDAISGAGVTKGCNPPENTEFCPDDNVTRGQMAAF